MRTRPFSVAALALLVFVWAAVFYRTATQSFVSAEWTVHAWILGLGEPGAGGLAAPLGRFFAAVFGVSEFALRLPDVLGFLAYLVAALLLCRLAFGDSWWLVWGFALAALNPLALDAGSTGTGRGVGLGCWTLAAYFIARWAVRGRSIPIGAAALLGLAVAADPAQVFGAAGLLAAFTVWLIRVDRRALVSGALPFWVVTAAIPALTYWITGPFVLSGRTAPRFLDGVKSWTSAFLIHDSAAHGFVARLGWLIVAAVLAGLCVVAVTRKQPLAVLFAVAAAVMAGLVWIEPRLKGQRFLGAEALVFALPVFSLGSAVALHRIGRTGFVLGVALVALFGARFQTHAVYGYEGQSATRGVIELLEQRQTKRPKNPLLVAAPPARTPEIDVYRRLRGINWLAQLPDNSLACPADYYYLSETDFDRLGTLGLRVIDDDTVAKTVLAERGTAATRRLARLHEIGFEGEPQCNAGLMAEAQWVDSNLFGAARYFLRDVAGHMIPARWRWTNERPAILLHTPRRDGVRFRLDFVIHGVYFKDKLPLELTVLVNGREIGRRRYAALEQQSFEAPVPPGVLREDGIALVETRLDKFYIAPEDNRKLGYLFVRGGFE